MISPYSGDAAKTIKKIHEGKSSYTANKIYHHSNGFYWFMNNRGFCHILQIAPVKMNGEFFHYAVRDSLVTKNNTIKSMSVSGRHKTLEEAEDAIKKWGIYNGYQVSRTYKRQSYLYEDAFR